MISRPSAAGHAFQAFHIPSTGNPQRIPACAQEKMHCPQVVLLRLPEAGNSLSGECFPCALTRAVPSPGMIGQKEEDVMSADSEPSSVWMRVCAWCGIILPGDEVTPGPAGGLPLITHGICPVCRDEFIRAVAAEKASARPSGIFTNGTH